MSHQAEPTCAILIGNAATCEKVKQIARNSQGCPNVTLYVATNRPVVGVFAVPASKQWWMEYSQEHPGLLGLEKVVVHVTERIETSSPWTPGTVGPILLAAPYGAECSQYPEYGAKCHGCPATTYQVRG